MESGADVILRFFMQRGRGQSSGIPLMGSYSGVETQVSIEKYSDLVRYAMHQRFSTYLVAIQNSPKRNCRFAGLDY